MPSWTDYRSTVNNSVAIDDSFNRKTEKTTNTTTTTDNSRKVAIDDSFNRSTDIRRTDDHSTNGSYNTDIRKSDDHSIRDSYNRSSEFDLKIDTQTVSPQVDTTKYVSTLDTQSANNSGSIKGPQMNGVQGGFYMGSVGEETAAPSYYGYDARVSTEDDRTSRRRTRR